MIRLRKDNSGGMRQDLQEKKGERILLKARDAYGSVMNSVFDSFAPAHLALRANLRLLFLKGSPAFSVVSSVVHSASFVLEAHPERAQSPQRTVSWRKTTSATPSVA